ncbi:MAG: hypothetical protein HY820_12570 [Acidobacteria bacterium]|nr:hypothetical protein [Acidobacteriota bacterium]
MIPLLERIVGFLLPPARREEVLGDLHERCRNQRQYLREASSVVPCVVFSQVRRVTDLRSFLLQGLLSYGAFLCSALWLNPVLLEGAGSQWLLCCPVALLVAGTALTDAYAADSPNRVARAGIGVAFTGMLVFLMLSVLPVGLPRRILLTGVVASMPLMILVRLFYSNGGREKSA